MISRRKRRRAVTLVEEIEQFPATQSLWWSAEPAGADWSHVRDAVATALTPKQREVVEAFFFEGRSQGEIARELGISQQVVQKRIFGTQRGDKMIGGALARLRTALSNSQST